MAFFLQDLHMNQSRTTNLSRLSQQIEIIVNLAKNMKILIGDNPGTMNAFKADLTSACYEVATAAESQQALRPIKTSSKFRRPFDLLVTDLKMPDLNGIELIREARSSIPPLNCILINAFGTGQTYKALNQMQNCIYLEKPFTPDSLMNLVRDSLRSQNPC
jgi:DNA-binding NtrC family response regulator